MAKHIKRLLKLAKGHSLFLFGPRQTGKSTLINEVFAKQGLIKYDLLIPEEYRRLANNTSRFRDEVSNRPENINYIVVDEVQKLPSLLDEVHYLLENLNSPPAFILTGSSSRKLKRQNINLLGGRAYSYSLYPLTYIEIQKSLGSFSLQKVLEHGSLPAVYLEDADPVLTLKSYVNTYIKEEVQIEALVRNLEAFVEFLRIAAEQNGGILNYSNIASDIGIDSSTVKEYYQILEDTMLGFMLRPIAKNLRRKVSKHPKFYFFDTGVARALNKQLSIDLDPKTKAYGDAFEHFVIKEFMHLRSYINDEYELSYYRTDNNAEVDLIIESPCGEIYAIEIKASDSPQRRDLKGLYSFREVCPQARIICASMSPNKYMLGDIEVWPWQGLFAEVFGGEIVI